MAAGNYILLYRDSIRHRYFTNVNLWHFYQYCMLKASYKQHEQVVGNQKITLERGQFVFGREKAAYECGLTVQQIRSCMKVLERDEKITINVTSKFSIITVLKFDSWQVSAGEDNQQINQQITSKQPANNQQITTNNKEKKDNNKNTLPFENAEEVFEKCWVEYPKKAGREDAWKHFKAQVKNIEMARSLFNAIQNYTKLVTDEGRERKHIKDGSGFFNISFWRDYAE